MCIRIIRISILIWWFYLYYSFIIASDYWQHRFIGKSVTLDMSMTYIIVAFATVLLNNVFLTLFSFKVRVLFGYAISMTTLIFVALCEVAWHMFNEKTAYSVNLVAVSLTAIGCTGILHDYLLYLVFTQTLYSIYCSSFKIFSSTI